MTFVTNGSCHRNGIAGEKVILDQVLNDPNLQEYLGGVRKASHLGGTGHKADVVFVRPSGEGVGISIKSRKSDSGTFDWFNSSTAVKYLPDTCETKKYRAAVKGSHARTTLSKKEAKKTVVPKYRKEFSQKAEADLATLTSEEIRNILLTGFEKYMSPDQFYVSVYHTKHGISKWFEFKDHPIVPLLQNPQVSFYSEKTPRAKSSFSIWCVLPDGTRYNTMTRLRLVLNNGVSCLLAGKKWGSNPSSSLVFKLQQDSPDKILEQIKNIHQFGL